MNYYIYMYNVYIFLSKRHGVFTFLSEFIIFYLDEQCFDEFKIYIRLLQTTYLIAAQIFNIKY